MMGEPVGRQDRLFYEFDLEDMVPSDHLLRRIDAAPRFELAAWLGPVCLIRARIPCSAAKIP